MVSFPAGFQLICEINDCEVASKVNFPVSLLNVKRCVFFSESQLLRNLDEVKAMANTFQDIPLCFIQREDSWIEFCPVPEHFKETPFYEKP